METSNQPTQKTPDIKPPVIPKAVKNFFFYGMKRSAKVKRVAKEYGEVLQIAYIIVPPEDKRIMKVICKDAENDIDFSAEELGTFLKALSIDKEKIQLCSRIFCIFDFKNKTISYQQLTKDGNKLQFVI
jgi:hypothetical protein